MLLHLIGLFAATAQLETASISIVFGDVTTVEAAYVIRSDADSLRFTMIRLRGQDVRLNSLAPGLASIDSSGGVIRLAVPAGGTEETPTAVRYEVRGHRTRIPLFVPDTPTNPAMSDILIRIDGAGTGVRLTDGFPRLTRVGDGDVIARPENLPSFVHVPLESGRLSINRVSEAAVVGLLLFGSVLWLMRRRALRASSSSLR